ncbi:MBL fold metallo-hydrolase [Nocardia tengchongensis]|uniref:MBL fold metallo-hydrolase n=1 Tax=Nocardia tengchongensis TaxID=2055889 RepID=UPI003611ACBF
MIVSRPERRSASAARCVTPFAALDSRRMRYAMPMLFLGAPDRAVLTHGDVDHAGGLQLFSEARVHVHRDALGLECACRSRCATWRCCCRAPRTGSANRSAPRVGERAASARPSVCSA